MIFYSFEVDFYIKSRKIYTWMAEEAWANYLKTANPLLSEVDRTATPLSRMDRIYVLG